MSPDWSLQELDELIGSRAVTFFDVEGGLLEVPATLAHHSDRILAMTDLGADHLHPSDRPEVLRAFARAMTRPGVVEQAPFRRVHDDGRSTWAWIRFLNLLQQPGIAAVLRLIDEHETEDEAPVASSSHSPAEVPWVRLHTNNDVVVAVDGMAEHLFGVPAREILGLTSIAIVHPDDLHVALTTGMAAMANPGTGVSARHRIVRPDGTSRDVETTLTVSSDDGRWSMLMLDAERAMHLELLHAVKSDELVVHYQPVVDARTTRIVGAEALVRWDHPTRGQVPPFDFIPVAESTGAIVEVGNWVLRSACSEAATWPDDLHLSVNLSVRQIADEGIVGFVRDALFTSGLPPGRLILEITESALMDRPAQVIGHLHELKALGIRLAIDDFGTGYSSLLYLKQMPVDYLKVDRSFVSGLGEDPGDTAIVASVVALAHVFGIEAIGEGVETSEQHEHLRRLNCDMGQGYLWSRPVPAEEFRNQLTPTAGRWTEHDIRQLIADKFVALYGPEGTTRPLPEWMRDASLGEVVIGGDIGVPSTTHVDDRLKTADAYRKAMFRPSEVVTTSYRTSVLGEWLVTELTLVNLLDHPLVGGVIACGLPGLPTDAPSHQPTADEETHVAPPWLVGRLDVSGRIMEIEGDVEVLTGRTADEVLGQRPDDLMHPDSVGDATALWWQLIGSNGNTRTSQRRFLHLDGTEVWAECTYRNRLGDRSKGDVLWVAHDVTERRARDRVIEERRSELLGGDGNRSVTLDRQADPDPLSAIVDRHGLRERLATALRDDPEQTLVVFFDLHGFQAVGDLRGQAAGDLVYRELGARMADAVRPRDTISRSGDNEFVLVCSGVGPGDDVALLDRLRLVLSATFLIDGGRWYPSARIGSARARSGDDAIAVVQRAVLSLFETSRVPLTDGSATPHPS